MDNTLFTLEDLLKRLSAIVAAAVSSLDLSQLKEGDRDTFLRAVTGRTINTFWKTYVETLPANVQQPLHAAIEQNDVNALTTWYAQYANLMEDAAARELATNILDHLEKELPKHTKHDLAAFTAIAQYA